jgi:hypothetical protein
MLSTSIFTHYRIRDLETDKKRFSKSRIIDELIQTEMDYFKVIKLVYDVYHSSHREYNVNENF